MGLADLDEDGGSKVHGETGVKEDPGRAREVESLGTAADSEVTKPGGA